MKDLIAKIEELVVAGRFTEARAELRGLNTRKIPRDLIETTANLCFRVNIPNLSLRILGGFMNDKRGLSTNLSESELTEYAIALS